MNINQRRAYTEMLEILNNVSENFKSKIPGSLIEKMNLEKDNNWNFNYNQTVALENQNILSSTKELYLCIYTNYVANKEEKAELESIYEKNKSIKYNPDDLFKNRVDKINQETSENDNIQNISTEISTVAIEKKWYQKLFNKIKNILKRK